MILSPVQYDVLFQNLSNRVDSLQAVRIWPGAVVPFMLDNNFSKRCSERSQYWITKLLLYPLAAAEKSLIRTAQNIIQKQSCVKFERIYSTDKFKDYVYIKSGHGCASTVGFWGGRQVLFLQKAVKACKLQIQIVELIKTICFPGMHGFGSDSSRVYSCAWIFPHAHECSSR